MRLSEARTQLQYVSSLNCYVYKYSYLRESADSVFCCSCGCFAPAASRRSDLEILSYCMVQWLCGRLPWEDKLQDSSYVRDSKIR